eukprot:75559-Lingulodinium_polyedra.AAC.1
MAHPGAVPAAAADHRAAPVRLAGRVAGAWPCCPCNVTPAGMSHMLHIARCRAPDSPSGGL